MATWKIGEAQRGGTGQRGHVPAIAASLGRACPRWHGDLAACLVGALDPQACAAVRRHLGTCPACQAEYEDLIPVLGWLASLTPPAAAAGPGSTSTARRPDEGCDRRRTGFRIVRGLRTGRTS